MTLPNTPVPPIIGRLAGLPEAYGHALVAGMARAAVIEACIGLLVLLLRPWPFLQIPVKFLLIAGAAWFFLEALSKTARLLGLP